MNDNEALARRRFLAISLIRLSGAVFTGVGLLVLAGKIDLPRAAGYLLTAVGFVDFLVVPLLLTRKWKSPNP